MSSLGNKVFITKEVTIEKIIALSIK